MTNHKLTDYPFDPALDITQLHGLDKLRAVEDRALAALALELYYANRDRKQQLPSPTTWANRKDIY